MQLGASTKEQVVRISSLMLAAIPTLGMKPMVLVILLWSCIVFLVYGLRTDLAQPRKFRIILLGMPFALMVLDLVRSTDPLGAWKLAETSSTLILFPLVFSWFQAERLVGLRKEMMDVFSWSALALGIWANGLLLMNGSWEVLGGGAPFSYAYRTAFSDVTGVHAPYAAYWFFCAGLFQVHLILDGGKHIRWRLLNTLVLFTAGTLIGSRTPILAAILALGALFAFRYPIRRAILYAVGGAAIIASLTIALPGPRERVIEAYTTMFAEYSSDGINSVNIRSRMLDCTLRGLEEHWMLGTGHLSVQPTLDLCYTENGVSRIADGSHGTHSQVLHWWFAFGILGLASFIVLFGISFKVAYSRRDAIHFAFLLFMLICCMTENVLSRQWGVVLFACFNSLFVFLEASSRNAPRPA